MPLARWRADPDGPGLFERVIHYQQKYAQPQFIQFIPIIERAKAQILPLANVG